jgi:hypothetical protein
MTERADKELLHAVLEPRKQGAMQAIADACGRGANPNAICPECSTAHGFVPGGSTLLTHSIHEGSFKAVAKLLECGADPNLADQNGWTPWMASTLVDGSKQSRIQGVLAQYGAKKSGDHIGRLARAVSNGDVNEAAGLIESGRDLEILAAFRIDLVGLQVSSGNAPMLKFLFDHGMAPTSTNLVNAIRGRNPEAVDLLLCAGLAPERTDQDETPLMTAAGMGEMKIVQRLVEAGADVNRSASEDGEWTASFHARRAGHTAVADWLEASMGDEKMVEQHQRTAARNPKFARLYEQATASELLSTDDIVRVIEHWDAEYGVMVTDAKADSLALEFQALPDALDQFVPDIVSVCPEAAESKSEILGVLAKDRRLFLWWD